MEKSQVEVLFSWLDDTTVLLQQYLSEPYLDSLTITMEILFYENVQREGIDEIFAHKLQNSIDDLKIDQFNQEDIRKAVQLAILKGMKDSTQQQHLMTPDTVALLAGYFADKLTKGKDRLRVFDPVSGTGNLLTTVLGQLKPQTESYAGEVDSTLIRLALLNANLQKREIEFFHQDSLRPFLMDPVDLVVADLPVGYYPDDVQAAGYELKSEEGHSYSHHLFIEQGMRYTVPGGHLILIVPEFLFDSDQSEKLHSYLQENAHIIGVIRLPDSAFKSAKNAKSILILQKKGEDTAAPKQPLLVQMPSFKNAKATADILEQMNIWFKNYHHN